MSRVAHVSTVDARSLTANLCAARTSLRLCLIRQQISSRQHFVLTMDGAPDGTVTAALAAAATAASAAAAAGDAAGVDAHLAAMRAGVYSPGPLALAAMRAATAGPGDALPVVPGELATLAELVPASALEQQVQRLEQQVQQLKSDVAQAKSDKIDGELGFMKDSWIRWCRSLVRSERKKAQLALTRQQQEGTRMYCWIRAAESRLAAQEANMEEIAEEISLGGYPPWAMEQLVSNTGTWLTSGQEEVRVDQPYWKPFLEWKQRDSRAADKYRAEDAEEMARITAEDPRWAQDWDMSTEDLTPEWLPF